MPELLFPGQPRRAHYFGKNNLTFLLNIFFMNSTDDITFIGSNDFNTTNPEQNATTEDQYDAIGVVIWFSIWNTLVAIHVVPFLWLLVRCHIKGVLAFVLPHFWIGILGPILETYYAGPRDISLSLLVGAKAVIPAYAAVAALMIGCHCFCDSDDDDEDDSDSENDNIAEMDDYEVGELERGENVIVSM